MYNAESQLDVLLQNENNHVQIKRENNGTGNDSSRRSSINSFEQNSVFNSTIYSHRNFRTNGSNYENNALKGAQDSYQYNNEQKYQDSSNPYSKPSLEYGNEIRSQNNFGSEEVYEKEEYQSNICKGITGFETGLYGNIQISDFGGLGRGFENDTSLPIANIGRLMKSVLPNSAKIAKQAKDMIRDCVTEFIFFISSEENMNVQASDQCTMERRKTLNADDIFVAMNKLGFENYYKPLKMYHNKWREIREQNLIQNNPRSQ